MTAPYKKRAKSGWNTDKHESNRGERTYEPTDIEEQLSEESKLSPVQQKKKPNKSEKKVKPLISDLKWALKWARGKGLRSLIEQTDQSYFSSHRQSLYQRAKKALPTLREGVNNPELSNKVKKHIRELLEQVGDE